MTTSDSSSHLQVPTGNPISAGEVPLGFTEQPLSCDVSSEAVYRMMDGYFDGVDSGMKQVMSSHMDDCDCCTEVFQFQLRLRSVIGSGCREELPADVRQRVLDSINQLF